MKGDGIGNRMKENYEDRYRIKLTRRTPVILRLDGKCFSKLTKYCQKPFDLSLANAIDNATLSLLKEAQGAKIAYCQSDEVSILLTDYDTLQTEAWFDNNLQKLVSVSASIMGASFTENWASIGYFDARAFTIPPSEVCNYFIWRQQDWIRNSVMMLARAHFSHKECHNKKQSQLHEMLHNIGINWAELDQIWKNGRIIVKEEGWRVEPAILFTEDREIIEQLVKSQAVDILPYLQV